MADHDFAAPRLFVEADLAEGTTLALERDQSHYLISVLRLGEGDHILVFNGRDGEWRASVGLASRRDVKLRVDRSTRRQPVSTGPTLLFAPLKHARLDYMVQKAVELGVASLRPVLTRRTVVSRVNLDRMRANAIEAAEQCGILAVPAALPAIALDKALADLPADRALVFCDEDAPVANPAEALVGMDRQVALLIGPEGGFEEAERQAILARPGTRRLSLGPRILRADTAAVAALAIVQSTLGDWR